MSTLKEIKSRKQQEDYLGEFSLSAFDFNDWALPKRGVVELNKFETTKGRMKIVYEPVNGILVARLANAYVGGSAYCHLDELTVNLVSAGHLANQAREQ